MVDVRCKASCNLPQAMALAKPGVVVANRWFGCFVDFLLRRWFRGRLGGGHVGPLPGVMGHHNKRNVTQYESIEVHTVAFFLAIGYFA